MRIFGMITTADSMEYSSHAIGSFIANTRLEQRDRFLLIDNDGSYTLPRMLQFSKLQIIRNDSPKGFAANMNLVLNEALSSKADAVLLNNDLIFPGGWIDALSGDPNAIRSPISNREMTYSGTSFETTVCMQLSNYIGREQDFEALASNHRKTMKGYHPALVLPFFCSYIPLGVIEQVGLLDETYGKGGAEDYDYCLRAWLAGAQVEYARSSYLLHFGGKSSWDGSESKEAQLTRESIFKNAFRERWGEALYRLALEEDLSVIKRDSITESLVESRDYGKLIESLRQTDTAEPPRSGQITVQRKH